MIETTPTCSGAVVTPQDSRRPFFAFRSLPAIRHLTLYANALPQSATRSISPLLSSPRIDLAFAFYSVSGYTQKNTFEKETERKSVGERNPGGGSLSTKTLRDVG